MPRARRAPAAVAPPRNASHVQEQLTGPRQLREAARQRLAESFQVDDVFNEEIDGEGATPALPVQPDRQEIIDLPFADAAREEVKRRELVELEMLGEAAGLLLPNGPQLIGAAALSPSPARLAGAADALLDPPAPAGAAALSPPPARLAGAAEALLDPPAPAGANAPATPARRALVKNDESPTDAMTHTFMSADLLVRVLSYVVQFQFLSGASGNGDRERNVTFNKDPPFAVTVEKKAVAHLIQKMTDQDKQKDQEVNYPSPATLREHLTTLVLFIRARARVEPLRSGVEANAYSGDVQRDEFPDSRRLFHEVKVEGPGVKVSQLRLLNIVFARGAREQLFDDLLEQLQERRDPGLELTTARQEEFLKKRTAAIASVTTVESDRAQREQEALDRRDNRASPVVNREPQLRYDASVESDTTSSSGRGRGRKTQVDQMLALLREHTAAKKLKMQDSSMAEYNAVRIAHKRAVLEQVLLKNKLMRQRILLAKAASRAASAGSIVGSDAISLDSSDDSD